MCQGRSERDSAITRGTKDLLVAMDLVRTRTNAKARESIVEGPGERLIKGQEEDLGQMRAN